jgi:hypothetical protein
MEQQDVEFLFNAFIGINNADMSKRKEWRLKEENLSRLIELHDKYGSDVVDAKTQEIKQLMIGEEK